MKKISQREARRLKRRVAELETILEGQRSNWSNDFPGGVNIDHIRASADSSLKSIKVARMLGHAVVAIDRSDDCIHFYAIPTPSPQ